MESEATAGAGAPAATVGAPVPAQHNGHNSPSNTVVHKESPPVQGLNSPPDSNGAAPQADGSDSELSDLDDTMAEDYDPLAADLADSHAASTDKQELKQEEEQQPVEQEPEQVEDIGEVLPDHWSGTVPVFKPTMKQFEDFKLFMEKVDRFGMTSGIIKIIPPEEWKASLPPLDHLVKQIRVREPIKQDIMGSNGTYRQVNIVHGRSYNLPQWRALCDQSEHQPPARRGERRANTEKPKPPRTRAAARKTLDEASTPAASPRRTRGRPRRGRGSRVKIQALEDVENHEEERPITPVSPKQQDATLQSVEAEPDVKNDEAEDEPKPIIGRMGSRQARPRGGGKQQSVSARRKYSRREGSAAIDEKAFEGWDYKMDISEYTPERCEELERTYWKTLTYAQPLYGADLMGTLFEEKTDLWNLNKLPNLLDVLGTKVPGVNTAYLYLGMWKATFAWHLEDVDLYSINYLHFGAPKQWYSISQADARRFEAAMRNIWPTDAKACDQFLRHKGFLISPSHLLQHYNIRVNKCLSYPGEFVVTYPYGYHSGYNLGYNCAEAVNFALDSWLPMGKIAKKCECAQAQDSVWVDVYEIERKLRGEETEYEETEEEEEEEEEDSSDEEEEETNGLPTPPSNVKTKALGRRRVKIAKEKGARQKKVKKVKIRGKPLVESPCCLCPNDIPGAEILPTDDGRMAHRMCALCIPEACIEMEDGKEVVSNVAKLGKDRLALKCLYCRSKKGACFQCSQRKCVRAYHATCAAAAGVFVEQGEIPIIGEDGTEYKEQAVEFSCRFHRTKRDKKMDGAALETCGQTREAAMAAKKGDIVQMQYYRGDIFAGVVVENNGSEQTLLVDIIPNGDRLEVEWKWLLLSDPADFHLPKASATAIPMPASRKAKERINATKRPQQEMPKPGAVFVEGFTWAEFNTADNGNDHNKGSTSRNRNRNRNRGADEQAEATPKVDLSKPNQPWYYIWPGSTDTKDRYTEDPSNPRHNPKSVFLDTLPKPAVPAPPLPTPTPAPRQYHPNHSHARSVTTPASAVPIHRRPIPAVVTPVPLPNIPGYRRTSSGIYPLTPSTAPTGTFSTFATPNKATGTPKATATTSHTTSGILSSSSTTSAPIGSRSSRPEKPYVYKPRNPVPPNSDELFTKKVFTPKRRLTLPNQSPDTRFDFKTSPAGSPPFSAERFEPALAHGYNPKISFTPTVGGYFPQNTASNVQPQFPPQQPQQPQQTQQPQQPQPQTPVGTAWPPTKTWATATSPVVTPEALAGVSMPPPPSRPQALSYHTPPSYPVATDVNNPKLVPQLPQLVRPQQLAQPQPYHQKRPPQTHLEREPQVRDQKMSSSRTFMQEAMETFPFFRLNHNRPTTAYKTPYAPKHGFTNGYEGNFRAHLMATQGSLLGKSAAAGTPSRATEHEAGYTSSIRGATGVVVTSPPSSSPSGMRGPLIGGAEGEDPSQSPSSPSINGQERSDKMMPPGTGLLFHPMQQPWGIKQPSSAPLHPAIRPQFQGTQQTMDSNASAVTASTITSHDEVSASLPGLVTGSAGVDVANQSPALQTTRAEVGMTSLLLSGNEEDSQMATTMTSSRQHQLVDSAAGLHSSTSSLPAQQHQTRRGLIGGGDRGLSFSSTSSPSVSGILLPVKRKVGVMMEDGLHADHVDGASSSHSPPSPPPQLQPQPPAHPAIRMRAVGGLAGVGRNDIVVANGKTAGVLTGGLSANNNNNNNNNNQKQQQQSEQPLIDAETESELPVEEADAGAGAGAGASIDTENFREFPSVEPNSMALMERMMANLRRASGALKSPVDDYADRDGDGDGDG